MKDILKLAILFEKLAVPLSSDYLENIHSEPLRKVVPPERDILVYHGTSTTKLENILAHGSLDPEQSRKAKSFENTSDGIYVTTQSSGFTGAEFYARKASDVHSGDPIILELSIPIGWIITDPDDSKLTETGELNQAGKVQGRVLHPIPVSHIKSVIVINPGFSSTNEYIPLATYIQNKLKEKGVGRKFRKLLKEKLPTSPSTEPVPDIESKMADALSGWHNNIFSPSETGNNGLTVYDNALIISFENKNNNAKESLKKFLDIFGHDLSDIEDYPEEYRPRTYESLRMFLNRYSRS